MANLAASKSLREESGRNVDGNTGGQWDDELDRALRPCLGSYLEFDIMKPLRAGASDAELRQFFLDVVERKPEQHDFRTTYQPGRKMVAIGG